MVGSGPAGLSAAYHLARAGYPVTVFESKEKAGGMLRYAIPRFRLPESVLDAEIKAISDLGVTFVYRQGARQGLHGRRASRRKDTRRSCWRSARARDCRWACRARTAADA